MTVLALLLGDLAPSEFFRTTWAKSFRSLPGPSHRFEYLFSWSTLGGILNAFQASLTHQNIRVVHRGRIVPFYRLSDICGKTDDPIRRLAPRKVESICRDGGTLVLRDLASFEPEIQSFSASIKAMFRGIVSLNAYYSHAAEQALDCHYDLHEIFVLQIEGEKTWYISDVKCEAPVDEYRSASEVTPTNFTEIVTKKGDALYLPRGLWHYAKAQNGPSLHVTVGIRMPTGVDLLKRVIAHLMTDATWRKNLDISYEDGLSFELDCISNMRQNLSDAILNAALHELVDEPMEADDYTKKDQFRLPY